MIRTKQNIVLLGLLILATWKSSQHGVNGQCMKLIPSYYECYKSQSLEVNDQENFTDDSFYHTQLGDVRSFDQAMDLFRTYYHLLSSCDLSNSKCECFVNRMSTEPDYSLFFNNASYFTDLKRIAAAVKSKYRLRSIEDINRDALAGQPFIFSLPSLNEFCLKFDFSYQMDMFYDKLRACKNSGHRLALAACIPTSIFSSDSQEKFLKCTYSYRNCGDDEDLKKFLALGDLVRYPQLIEDQNLATYIDYLTSSSSPKLSYSSLSLIKCLVASLILVTFK